MAHVIRVDELEIRETLCRTLEIQAETAQELAELVARAQRKGWCLWLEGTPSSRPGWAGAVLEKDMPRLDDPSELVFLEQFRAESSDQRN